MQHGVLMAHSEHMLSFTTLPCTWITEASAMLFPVMLSCSLEVIRRESEGGHESPGSSKSSFPSVSLNLIYVTAFPAKYRHCGCFSRPVEVSYCVPEQHFFFFCWKHTVFISNAYRKLPQYLSTT